MSSQRRYSIDFFKFIFMLIIVLWHSDKCDWLVRGYIPVEFYFVLSGYFLFASFVKHPEVSAVKYTWNKAVRFFPEYSTVLVIYSIVDYISRVKNGLSLPIVDVIKRFFAELFFVQTIGPFPSGVNYPCWYLSVLVYGGFVVYLLLRLNSKLSIRLFLPVIVILFYSFIFSRGSLNQQWDTVFGISIPFLRGIAGLSLGVILGGLSQSFKVEGRLLIVFRILSILALVLTIISFVTFAVPEWIVLIAIAVFVFALIVDGDFYERSFLTQIPSGILSTSYEMLILHVPVMYFVGGILNLVSLPSALVVVIYLVITVICSYYYKQLFSKISIRRV